MKKFFVTGTDTDVGKTFICSLLAREFSKRKATYYYKPIQAGKPGDQDQVMNFVGTRVQILKSTYWLEAPLSPDRASKRESKTIETKKILEEFKNHPPGLCIVEGVGGVEVPINDYQRMKDLMAELHLPVLIVASTRLGTINHTLLSVQALRGRGLDCLGIVLNGKKDLGLAEILERKTGLPILFEVPKFTETTEEKLDEFFESNTAFRCFVDRCLNHEKEVLFSDPRDDLQRRDRQLVWHPFTQHGIVNTHPVVHRAKGAYLWYQGRKVIDAISSWWVNLFGHCHPLLSRVVSEQAHSLEHVLFAGFSHKPAIELSEKLVHLTRKTGCELSKVFFSDNGSTSVEVALKMVYQYQQLSGHCEKKRFLALKGSYHGDTLGAMSVGERDGFHQVFRPLLFGVDFVDPFDPQSLEGFFEKKGHELAGVIVEPMVQGASGMAMYPVEFLNRLWSLARQYQVMIICDEVFTGFYRTGKMFAFEYSDLKPDLLCLSKGLTGGYLPLAVTLTSEELYQCFLGDSMKQAFLHGHSYTANPISCRVACATLDLLMDPKTHEQIRKIESQTGYWVEKLSENPGVFNARQLGTIGAMEVLDQDPHYFKGDFTYKFNQKALKKGVLLRPLGGTVYVVPPYCVRGDEIDRIYSSIGEIVNEGF